MIGHGVSSFSSHSAAAGRITFSAKSWTHFWIWSWSSFSSSEKSVMLLESNLGLGLVPSTVRLGELFVDLSHVVGLFLHRLRRPLAAGLADEVAAVDVDGAGEPLQRVGDRVDGVV